MSPRDLASPEHFIPRQGPRHPHHGLGRGFKVGKEEIVGLIVALQMYVRSDSEIEIKKKRSTFAHHGATGGCSPFHCRLLSAAQTGRYPLLELAMDEAAMGRTASAISLELQKGDPPVHLNERRVSEGILTVSPAGLRDGDELAVVARLLAVLGANP
jgi:L-seryl-tRNA(Ser) seleniumtransferase